MLIRLLGPVEVERSGTTRPVRPPQVALALSALAWEVGRVVPVESLMSRIWGEQVPPGARRTLHTVLTRIRHEVLGSEGAVIRRLGGYLLDVDESAVDVSRFRNLARLASAGPDPAQRLDEALHLWSGEPLTGLPGEWAERARRRLRDERKETLLHWARLVAGGDAAAAVAALAPLAEEYPLDELVSVALIEALHAWGRTAEALAHFARVRRTLAGELGVEPGASLQQVHRRLLRSVDEIGNGAGDATMNGAGNAIGKAAGTATGSGAGLAGVVPRQLPVGLRYFVGRTDELERLAVLGAEERPAAAAVCAISGPPGVGKSSVALRWAHLQRDRFPGGQLYADLGTLGRGAAAAVLPRFLGALGLPESQVPSAVEAQVGLYRSMLAGRRVLVVLDNAHDATQVGPLLATGTGCTTLVTSRSELSGLAVTAGADTMKLDVLPAEDAHRLLVAWLGAARPAAEPEAAMLIIRRCGRLPLALAIVAARLSQRPDLPLAEVAADLEQAETDLEPFAHSDPRIDLRGVFGRSYRDLSGAAAAMFRRLGQHPGRQLSVTAAASLAGLPVERTRELAARLDGVNLVELHPPGRLHLHALLRGYASEQARAADGPEVRRAATRRLLDHYLHSACAAGAVCHPHREQLDLEPPEPGTVVERFAEPARALRWYADESVALPDLLAEAAAAGSQRHVWRLAWAFAEFMQRRGLWEEVLRLHAVALEAARGVGDRLGEAHCHNSIARAHVKLGRDQEAVEHFHRAIEVHRELDEPVLLAYVLLGLAGPLSGERPDRALVHTLRALRLFRRAGDRVAAARALNNAGWLRAQLGAYDVALRQCRRAQRVLADLECPQGEGHAWDSIAHVLGLQGDLAGAVECFEKAAERFRRCDDLHPAAATLVRLGETHVRAGDVDAALDAWTHAARLYDALGDGRAVPVRERIASHHTFGAAGAGR